MPKPIQNASLPTSPSHLMLRWTAALLSGCAFMLVVVSAEVMSQDAESSSDNAARTPGEFGVDGLDALEGDGEDQTLIEDEKLTDEEENALKVELRVNRADSVLRAGDSYSKNRELIQKSIRYGVNRLTMKKYRNSLSDVSGDFLRDIRNAAFLQSKPALAESFRKAYLTDVMEQLVELLDGNFNVRMQAVVLLAELNLVESNAAKQRDAVAFVSAKDPLMKVIRDKNQKTALKVVAVNGLRRILETADPKTNDKVEIAEVLASEISDPTTHSWYQRRLAETLGATDLVRDNRNQPLIIKTLVDVLMDTKRKWNVRAEAACALGRAEYDTKVNITLVSFEIVEFAAQFADYLKTSPSYPDAQMCAWRIYTAFQPADAYERTTGAGLISKVEGNTFAAHRPKVESAYQAILPFAKLVVNVKAGDVVTVPQTTVDQLNTWVQQNRPADLKIDPNLQPIAVSADQQQANATTADASR